MNFNNEYVSSIIKVIDNKVKITGNSKQNYLVEIVAANPADKLGNYSGTNLPFPNYDIAFENTPNYHKVENNIFDITFEYPNSYYSLDKGMIQINPSIKFMIYKNEELISNISVELPNKCNLKTLINRNINHVPEFYDDKYHILPVATAENTMYNYSDFKIINNGA
tara:strand:- start:1486 stop:1983 length:498 start_codon:yes stop_codon:yes gene_type:complete